jgi:hypothetical protein
MFDIRQVFQWKGNFPVVAEDDVISPAVVNRAKHSALRMVDRGCQTKGRAVLMVLAQGMGLCRERGAVLAWHHGYSGLTVWMDG